MAQILDKLNIGDNTSFDVYPSALLGTQYSQVVILAILDADSVRFLNIDPAAMHAKVYATLPAGTPNDPYQYQWLKLRLTNGTMTAIGIPWINPNSIAINTTSTITAVFEDVSPTDLNIIRTMCAANGYNNVAITIK